MVVLKEPERYFACTLRSLMLRAHLDLGTMVGVAQVLPLIPREVALIHFVLIL